MLSLKELFDAVSELTEEHRRMSLLVDDGAFVRSDSFVIGIKETIEEAMEKTQQNVSSFGLFNLTTVGRRVILKCEFLCTSYQVAAIQSVNTVSKFVDLYLI